jgi:hypothetical protein
MRTGTQRQAGWPRADLRRTNASTPTMAIPSISRIADVV